ncbi:MAG: hypothetical protein KA409_03000 [Ferruginibacter sp.]|nr:hypothetical protein [Chitinophagaceae bacterium]MBP6285860.1 hypothetical protein [Ferruginibacter sp.]
MHFTLLSPIKVAKTKKDGPFQGSFEARVQHIHTFQEHGLEIKKPIETFFKSIPKGQYQAEIPSLLPLTKEVAETYLKFQSIITHCITNGEAINNQLRELLLTFKELKHSKEEIMQMDFMGLRGVFSDFLHHYTAIKKEPNFSTKEQRKGLTKMMHQFISDRNIYTHGTLLIQRPEEIFVIDYIEEKKTKQRCEITLAILQSFLQASILIRNLLLEVGTFYRNSKRNEPTNS